MTEKVITLLQPHPGQMEVIQNSARFNVVACGRRWGKSGMAVNLCSEPALEGFPVGYFTPTYKLLDGTYSELLSVLEPVISRKHEHQFIELITGGKIEFWSLENEMAGRSRKYKRVVVDEGAFVKRLWSCWTESIRPTLTDLKGDAFFLSSPKGKNDFHKLFMRGRSGQANWASFQKTTYDNPYIDPEEVDDAKADLPEDAFKQEYLAEFLDNIANPFGSAFIAQCTFPLSTLPPVCYGIDLAKYTDWTVIIGLDRHGQVCYFDRFQADWRTTEQRILSLPPAPICVDSTGVGDPIGEAIAAVRPTELFKFTANSKQQLMMGLQAAIQKRACTFPEGHITDELSNFTYEYTSTGVKYTAPGGLHDDCVMALGLAWHKWQTEGQFSGNISIEIF